MSDIIQQLIDKQIEDSILVKQALAGSSQIMNVVREAAGRCISVYRNNRKILAAGNGGSAADAQHMVAELSGRFRFDRPGIPAIALTANSSAVTAISNDYGYHKVFSRQIQALGQPGDLFMALSTSGNSQNMLEAVEQARVSGLGTIGLTGAAPSELSKLCDICIQVPSLDTARVQECHILIIHLLCAAVEETLFGKEYGQLTNRSQFPLARDPEQSAQRSVTHAIA